jgi:hypothetical protein
MMPLLTQGFMAHARLLVTVTWPAMPRSHQPTQKAADALSTLQQPLLRPAVELARLQLAMLPMLLLLLLLSLGSPARAWLGWYPPRC